MKRVFDEERTVYETHKTEWLRGHRGEFVLIKGSEVLGFFPDRDSAYQAGLRQLGNVDMLIHEVAEVDPVALLPSVNIASAS